MKELLNPISILLSSILGFIGSYLAYRQKKNPYLWFVLGFFLGFIGLFFLMMHKKPKTQDVNTKPALILHGPSDKLWFYLDPSHQQIGPLSYLAMIQAFAKGTISINTYVWHEELTEWKKLGDLSPLKGS